MTVPYTPRDIANGLSFQDFQFSYREMARGWKHVVVRDTIIFKRRRDFSLVAESKIRRSLVRALPEMAIDRVRDLPLAAANQRSHTDRRVIWPSTRRTEDSSCTSACTRPLRPTCRTS